MNRSVLIRNVTAALCLSACAPARPDSGVATRPPDQVTSLIGKPVWVYGGGPLRCVLHGSTTVLSIPLTTPVRVTAAQRTGRRAVEIGTDGHRPAQMAAHPLVLTLRPEGPTTWVSSSSGSFPAPWESGLEGKSCAEFKVAFVDEAHLNRVLSRTPPPPDVLVSVQRRLSQPPTRAPMSLLGLTPRQVLWLQGPPDEPLTDLDTLLKATTWTVLGPPGYGDHVMTFENGSMAGETFPSPMP